MTKLSVVFAVAALGAACTDKVDPEKGVLEAETPPGSPLAGPAEGKSDSGGTVLTVAVESAHPYANDLDRAYPIDLASRVPTCAADARVHGASIRTEAGYDFVHLEGATGRFQTFDGNRDNWWSDWGALGATKQLAVRLETDGSVVKDGFRIDAVEYRNLVRCPLLPITLCPAGQVDVTPVPGECGCRGATQCAPDDAVSFEHTIGGGFAGTYNGHRATGTHRSVKEPCSGIARTSNSHFPLGGCHDSYGDQRPEGCREIMVGVVVDAQVEVEARGAHALAQAEGAVPVCAGVVVQADHGVRHAGPARDEAQPGTSAAHAAIRDGHVGCAALMTADD